MKYLRGDELTKRDKKKIDNLQVIEKRKLGFDNLDYDEGVNVIRKFFKMERKLIGGSIGGIRKVRKVFVVEWICDAETMTMMRNLLRRREVEEKEVIYNRRS